MKRHLLTPALLLTTALAACAPQMGTVASAAPPPVVHQQDPERPDWAFEASDIAVDPAFRFGKLANGLRYVIRQNATPAGQGLVRMQVNSGSLSETDSERGFAHFIEHMAFNGSTNVPEGDMVKLLEREGLAFGADTNAFTGFEQTQYKLDLPRNDPALLDTALMLMRETASELTFSPEAVARERGVVLAERRDRNTFALRNVEDQFEFLNPQALYPERFPIGTPETLNAATADTIKAFWTREYVPSNTYLVVVGDFDPVAVEANIRARFGDWQAAAQPAEPDAGPVDAERKGLTEVFLDPALSERVMVAVQGAYRAEADSVAVRQQQLLRAIGYGIVNRRFQRIARQGNPPFRGAGFGTSDTFKAGRMTNLIVDSGDGEWQTGLIAAAQEYRRALEYGFTAAEVAEQVSNLRTATQNAAASADTRPNGALAAAVFNLIDDEVVPSTPQSALTRLEAFIPAITPDAVFAAMQDEALPLDNPLIRFQGRTGPTGGADAVRAAWNTAMTGQLAAQDNAALREFAYGDFGTPGIVVSDTTEAALGIRTLTFANGVRLNLKRTDLEQDKIRLSLNIDGGDLLNTRDDPLATAMVAMLPVGGLGKHSQDDLQSILAGRAVGLSIASEGDAFVAGGSTTPRDLSLQLDLLAAAVTDPGYRPQGEDQYRRNIANYFAQKDATPGSALANALGGILSDDDPRFTLQPADAYAALSFARLKDEIADRLAHGAIEIGIVGDVDPAIAIADVARTFGALPPREATFRDYSEARRRSFTTDRQPRTVYHDGAADQGLVRYDWPTTDDGDPVEALKLELFERVVQIELTDTLREALGKSYSPSVASSPSRIYPGYGDFAIAASVDVADLPETRAAIAQTLAALRKSPVDADILQRARQPLLEAYANALKTNGGWLSLVDRAQSQDDRIARFQAGAARLRTLTAADLLSTAQKYLDPQQAVTITVLPRTKS